MASDGQSYDIGSHPYYTYRTEAPTPTWTTETELSVPTEPGTKKLGIVEVSFEALKKLLGIDKCHTIVKVSELYVRNGVFSIMVESENLEEVAEAAIAPKVSIAKINGYDE